MRNMLSSYSLYVNGNQHRSGGGGQWTPMGSSRWLSRSESQSATTGRLCGPIDVEDSHSRSGRTECDRIGPTTGHSEAVAVAECIVPAQSARIGRLRRPDSCRSGSGCWSPTSRSDSGHRCLRDVGRAGPGRAALLAALHGVGSASALGRVAVDGGQQQVGIDGRHRCSVPSAISSASPLSDTSMA